jgi:hypothetical protein
VRPTAPTRPAAQVARIGCAMFDLPMRSRKSKLDLLKCDDPLLDDLIRPPQQRRRDRQAEGIGRPSWSIRHAFGGGSPTCCGTARAGVHAITRIFVRCSY